MGTPSPTYATVDDYIAAMPEAVRPILDTLRAVIKAEAPDATEAIKYGIPTYIWHGNLVYFAAWKKHVSMYPVTDEMEAALPDMASYKTSGKGTVQFPLNKPLPLALIRSIVQFRLRENQRNATTDIT